jgi:hypothetical protein
MKASYYYTLSTGQISVGQIILNFFLKIYKKYIYYFILKFIFEINSLKRFKNIYKK